MQVATYYLISLTVTLFIMLTYAGPKRGSGIARFKVDEDEENLMKDLLAGHKPELRPVMKRGDNITVKFGISLHQIIDMHEKNQILKTSLWVRQSWYNPYLVWNASYYGGIRSVNVAPSKVWTPDLYLYNNADERDDGAMDRFHTKVVLTDKGMSQWLAPVILSSSCKIDVKYFPFDEQGCDLKFGSWTYDGFKLDVVRESANADTKKFVPNGEWDLISFPAERNVLHYICCKEPYPDVTFTLYIRRRSTYYYINIIIPCVLITALTLLSFYLPPDSGERITLVITNLLALTVFMLLVAEIMPSTSEVVPLISIYYTCTIMEVGIALVATCIVLKFYFHNPEMSDMPAWMRLLVLGWLAKLLRVDVQEKKMAYKRRSSFRNVCCRPECNGISRESNLLTARDRFYKNNEKNEKLDSINLTTISGESTDLLRPNGQYGNGNICNGEARTSRRGSSTSEISGLNAIGMRGRDNSNFGSEAPLFHTHTHTSCKCELDEPFVHMLGSQSLLLTSVNKLVKNNHSKASLAEQKYEWILAANIIDKGFFILFLFLLLLSTFIMFSHGNFT